MSAGFEEGARFQRCRRRCFRDSSTATQSATLRANDSEDDDDEEDPSVASSARHHTLVVQAPVVG